MKKIEKIEKLSDTTFMVGDVYVDLVSLRFWADSGKSGATIHDRRSDVYILGDDCGIFRNRSFAFAQAQRMIDRIKAMGYKF